MKIPMKTVFGIIIMALGVILLLGALDIFAAGDILADYWPVIIMLFGLYNIFDQESPAFFGIILLLIGGYLQMRVLDINFLGDVSLAELLLPIIIILIGIKVLWPSGRQIRKS